MKKLLILCLALVFALSGCGSSEQAEGKPGPSSSSTSSSSGVTSSESEPAEAKADRPILTEPGQQAETDAGHLKLLKIASINKDYTKNGLKIHVSDAKVFEVTHMTDSFKSMLADYFPGTGDKFYYLQFRYDVSNPYDETITWPGFVSALPDNGEQIDIYENDLIGQNPKDGDIMSKATLKDNLFGIPVDKDIKSIRVVPEEAFDASGMPKTNDGIKEVKITF